MVKRKSRSKVLTIMMIDIVGYTKLSSHLGRDKFEKLNIKFDEIALPIFAEYHGWVVKKVGDCFVVVFESATDSLLCARDLQNSFMNYNRTRPEVPIKIKVAVNSGEVLIKDNDIYGEAVNAVSRIEKLTKPGQILFSEAVFLAMNKGDIPHVFLGRRRVKGLKYPLALFRVKGVEEDEKKRRVSEKRKRNKIIKRLIIFVVILIIGYYSYPYVWPLIKNFFG
jgi:adenylate cyclase